jgi:hypothetical protein
MEVKDKSKCLYEPTNHGLPSQKGIRIEMMRYSCKRVIATHVPEQLLEALDREADRQYLSRSQLIRDCISFYLSKLTDVDDSKTIRQRRDNLIVDNGFIRKLFEGRY